MGAAAAVAIVSAIGVPWGIRSRKKSEGHLRHRLSIVSHLANDLDVEEKIAYKGLNNHEDRMNWLQRHYPEFVEAAAHCPGKKEKVIAKYLDLALIENVYLYNNEEEAIREYLNLGSQQLSLDEYQAVVNIQNKQMKRNIQQEQRKAEEEAEKAAEEKRQSLDKIQQEQAPLQEAADKYWDSLTDARKNEFRQSFGKVGRLYSLPSALHTGYTLNELHSVIMATHFPHIEVDAPRSIQYYETLVTATKSSSPYLDKASYSAFSTRGMTDTGGGGSYGGDSDGGGGGGGE